MLDDVVLGQKGDCRQRYNNMVVAGSQRQSLDPTLNNLKRSPPGVFVCSADTVLIRIDFPRLTKADVFFLVPNSVLPMGFL